MSIEVVDIEIEKLRSQYASAMHAVQSGVKMLMSLGVSAETDLKHLRVGINSALLDSATVVRLLIAKGIITEREHLEALVTAAEEERQSYEKQLTERLGKPVKLY